MTALTGARPAAPGDHAGALGARVATARTVLPIVLALAAATLTLVAVTVVLRDDRFTAADGVRLVLAGSFVAAGLALGRNVQTHTLGVTTLALAGVAGLEYVGAAGLLRAPASDVARPVESLAATVLLAVAFHLLLVLPDGRLATVAARRLLAFAYLAAVGVGIARWRQQPHPAAWPLVLFAGGLAVAGLVVSNRRYAAARGVDRHRMQWLGLALALCTEIALLVAALGILVDWPSHPRRVIAASLVLVAAALAAAASPRVVGRVDRLLTHAVSFAGLSAVVTLIYLLVVVGLGRVPTDNEKTILVLSMAAAAVSAVIYLPARDRLHAFANQLVYGEARDPTEALETFGSRLTRALPMDELLLQLAELCKKHLGLRSSEVWTGVGGQLSLAAAVPDVERAAVVVGPKELPVVTRTRASGRGWAEVWLKTLVAGRGAGPLRIVPLAHSGELFGVLVLERADGDDDFGDEDDRVLAELARQVALALHNSELDTALQTTLEEVQRKNVELQESRARIVAAADGERRKIERNLHDGAQQHLVALAVKLRLIQRLADADPPKALAMLEEARTDALATIDELRALAHGIYPPLLMDKGLPDALAAAAGRAALPTTVETTGVGRYRQDVEAAVYFCCLEALQNAGKHAGEGATASVTVEHVADELRFEVADDGAGFDTAARGSGHGFVNMADRLGAIGGSVHVRAAPGQGTRISGSVPAVPAVPGSPPGTA